MASLSLLVAVSLLLSTELEDFGCHGVTMPFFICCRKEENPRDAEVSQQSQTPGHAQVRCSRTELWPS